MTFGEKVRSRRKYLQLTQQELADKIGISRRAVISYEKDISQPRTNEDYARLAEALDVNVNVLLTEDSQCTPVGLDFMELMNKFSCYNSDSVLDSEQLKMWEQILEYVESNCVSLVTEEKICIRNCRGYIRNLFGEYRVSAEFYSDSIGKLTEIDNKWNKYFVGVLESENGRIRMPETQEIPGFTSLFDYLYMLGDTHYRRARVMIRDRKYDIAESDLLLSYNIITCLYENSDMIPASAGKEDWIEQYLPEIYNGLALVNRYTENFMLAKNYSSKALKDRMRFDNPAKGVIVDPCVEWKTVICSPRTAEYFNTLGQIYIGMGRAEGVRDENLFWNAAECFDIAQQIRLNIDDRNPALSEGYNNLGKAYELLIPFAEGPDDDSKKQELFKKALENHQKALEYKLRPNYTNQYRLSTTYRNIGTLYKTMEMWHESLDNYQKCLSIRYEFCSESDKQITEIEDTVKEIKDRLQEMKDGTLTTDQ
ncbi:MAG: helix-turn-helix transcriptional regulator [Lachnospiraceae bacterium]|nr:helix-turn-helix transcriptional regulator [Lachnospiraceae bacterium]